MEKTRDVRSNYACTVDSVITRGKLHGESAWRFLTVDSGLWVVPAPFLPRKKLDRKSVKKQACAKVNLDGKLATNKGSWSLSGSNERIG
jgi:hypothetical protein